MRCLSRRTLIDVRNDAGILILESLRTMGLYVVVYGKGAPSTSMGIHSEFQILTSNLQYVFSKRQTYDPYEPVLRWVEPVPSRWGPSRVETLYICDVFIFKMGDLVMKRTLEHGCEALDLYTYFS